MEKLSPNAKDIYIKLRKVLTQSEESYNEDDVAVIAEHLDKVGIKAEDI